MQELEKALGDKEKLQAKAQSNLTKQKDIIKSENKKLKNLQSNKTEVSTFATQRCDINDNLTFTFAFFFLV